ncbi:cold-inducible RNA-binding protein [Vigna unguiculata]|uniref:Cold-inducible RNA-binding protein n=1 Tax=Vigna unguiculata TaxID=3917 RepID=A0A4D6MQG1_VIGUN|nr:cold-inducible RNA-binding protein [Vigna unguiculata]
MKGVYLLVAVLALTSSVVSSYDPSPLQDFCVAIKESDGVFVNGKFCKDPKAVKAEDFFLHVEPGNTDNPLNANVTPVAVDQLPGLNTLGISLARIDFAPKGLNPPHTHPRGTEILIVLEGTLYVGFVTSNQDGNRLFTKVLNNGDVFVFPIGLIHFQLNVGYGNAVAIAGLSSQNPGTITIANALFKAVPPISVEVLARALQVDNKVIEDLQRKQCIPQFPEFVESVCQLVDVDPAHQKIFIHGLSWDATTETLTSVFGKYGEIEDCKAVIDKVSGKSKGYTFILFKHKDDACKALKNPQKNWKPYNLLSVGLCWPCVGISSKRQPGF